MGISFSRGWVLHVTHPMGAYVLVHIGREYVDMALLCHRLYGANLTNARQPNTALRTHRITHYAMENKRMLECGVSPERLEPVVSTPRSPLQARRMLTRCSSSFIQREQADRQPSIPRKSRMTTCCPGLQGGHRARESDRQTKGKKGGSRQSTWPNITRGNTSPTRRPGDYALAPSLSVPD